jgi:cytochrome b561
MSIRTGTRFRYGAVAQVFHWLTAALVATAYLSTPGGSEQRAYSVAFDFTREFHETTGMLVVAIVLLRVLWRLTDSTPEAPPMAPWMKLAATLTHCALYALLIAIPSTAILGAWWEGHALTLLGGLTFAPMLAQAHDLGATVADIHTYLGNAIIWLAGLHAVAALFHHFVLRDRVLLSMLPDWPPLQAQWLRRA